MQLTLRTTRAVQLLMVIVFAAGHVVNAQQGAATGPPLVVRTTSLPKAYLKRPYESRLEATGGITPLVWQLSDGVLPPGITLRDDGSLTGIPTETGEFHFTVSVRDNGKPAYEKQQPLSLVVVAPLLVQWGRYPAVNGQRIEGSVLLSNQTEQDFDLTVIIVAVNENGRATAVGYQRLSLKKDVAGLEVPFGENLPQGAYELDVDAVAEVAGANAIYRARLVPKEKLQVQQGP